MNLGMLDVDLETLAERLSFAISQSEYSEAQLAQKIGCTQQAINKITQGLTFKSKHLPEIAKTLQINYEWLVNNVGEMHSEKNKLLTKIEQLNKQHLESIETIIDAYLDKQVQSRH